MRRSQQVSDNCNRALLVRCPVFYHGVKLDQPPLAFLKIIDAVSRKIILTLATNLAQPKHHLSVAIKNARRNSDIPIFP